MVDIFLPQTASMAHPVSYPMDTRFSYPEG